MKNIIKHTFFFPHPAEMVWDYLTKPELLKQWVMPNDIKPVVGHKFEFTTKPIPSMDFDGHFYCEMLEVVPFKKLTYSWKGGPEPGIINLDTVVYWTLVTKDNGTELNIEQTGFKDIVNAVIYDGMNGGWAQNIQKMLGLLNPLKNA